MRLSQHILVTICAAAALTVAPTAFAQSDTPHRNVRSASQNRLAAPREANDPDQTLEIAPRIAPSTPAATQSPSVPDDTAPVPTSGVPASELNPRVPQEPNQERPYLGISVQYIISHAIPGHEVHGLEVVGVDSNSPAERSGLRGRGTMTKLGASGATAGALMPPLDLVVMPLLKKSGQLGEVGDLIVAIDDKRIESEADLETELDMLKPGDTIYFTIERARRNDPRETLKIPVKLGDAGRSADNRSRDNATGNIVPLAPSH